MPGSLGPFGIGRQEMQNERTKQLLMIVGIIVIAAMFLPFLVEWATGLLAQGISEVGSSIQNVLHGAFNTRDRLGLKVWCAWPYIWQRVSW
jgi:hypothetical protein